MAGYVGHRSTCIYRVLRLLTSHARVVPELQTSPPHRWLSGRTDCIPSMRCGSSKPASVQVDADVERWRGRAGSSLAYTDQTVTAERPLTCPNAGDRVVVELVSGQVFPDRCRATRCDFCLPLNARRRCLAITLANPVRMIRLSLVASSSDESPCRTALIRIKRIRQALKRMGVAPGEWCFTLERNPKETGYHAHCLQTGGYISQAVLQEACGRARAGIPYINAIKREGIWTSRYGLKGFGADGYGLKTFRPNSDSTEALRINNGRLEHHSRGFYEFEGEVLKVRDMERAAITTLNADKPVAFVGMRGEDAARVIGDLRLKHSLIRDLRQRSATGLRIMR